LLLGAEREFCCAGCEAVTRTIVDGGLAAYYETRTQPACSPRAACYSYS
jgi:Cu2+-exporting ATPase